jgi:dimethylaniline monooxygenase (N-oxide forming)
MLGASRVASTFRRQRYVVQKLVAGVPSDALAFTRFAALNAEVTPSELLGKTMQDYILRVFGSPEQFGAFRPAGDFLTVGRALSQHFLPLVAEGRIAIKPWISGVWPAKNCASAKRSSFFFWRRLIYLDFIAASQLLRFL